MSDVFSSATGGGEGSFTSTLTLPLKGEGKRFFAALRMTVSEGFRVRMTIGKL